MYVRTHTYVHPHKHISPHSSETNETRERTQTNICPSPSITCLHWSVGHRGPMESQASPWVLLSEQYSCTLGVSGFP